MKNQEIKFRQSHRDSVLDRILSEVSTDRDTIQNYALLKEKFRKASIHPDDAALDQYVELNSIVAVKTSFGFRYGLQLVLPEDSDIQSNKLSVLSSLGAAIFGHKEGVTVEWYWEGEREYAEIIKVVKGRANTTKFSFLG